MQPALRIFVIPALAAAAASSASAQFSSNLEALSASAAGTLLTGQDGYYLPAGLTSVDFNAYTYAGNVLGISPNPNGGNQFVAANGPGTANARAQRDVTFTSGRWTAGYDINVTFQGTLPTAQNIGSFSLQPSGTNQNFIALARWVDTATAANWNADYVWYDATGLSITESVAHTGFQSLLLNRWYRWETDFDFTTNEVLEVRLTDLVTGTSAVHNPVGRYLFGGTAGAPAPTAFRFFAGSTVAGNTVAYDNPSLQPGIASIGTRYCTPAVPNSTGSSSRLQVIGSALVAANNVTLAVSDLPVGAFGFFLTSMTQGLVMMPGGSQGNLCLGGGIGRYVAPGQIQISGAGGTFQLVLNLNLHPTPGGLVPVNAGETWNFQSWHRDLVGGVPTSNFSDAVSVGFL